MVFGSIKYRKIIKKLNLTIFLFYAIVTVEHGIVCWPHQRPELRFPLFVCHASGR
jgi:hypothetical protein